MATDTRERMIATTARLIQHRGYHGTSLNDILAESGAPRGSLYFHFPGGKDELVIEATRASTVEATFHLRQALADAKTPAKGIRAFFEVTAGLLSESGYTFGCPVAPVILDDPDSAAELKRICRDALDEWTGLYREAFVRAGLSRKRANALALVVESAHEGLMLIARARRDASPLVEAARELEALIETSMPAAPREPGKSRSSARRTTPER